MRFFFGSHTAIWRKQSRTQNGYQPCHGPDGKLYQHFFLEGSGRPQPDQVSPCKAPKRASSCRDHYRRFLGSASRNKCEQDHPLDGETPGSERANGQCPAARWQERYAATTSGLLLFV